MSGPPDVAKRERAHARRRRRRRRRRPRPRPRPRPRRRPRRRRPRASAEHRRFPPPPLGPRCPSGARKKRLLPASARRRDSPAPLLPRWVLSCRRKPRRRRPQAGGFRPVFCALPPSLLRGEVNRNPTATAGKSTPPSEIRFFGNNFRSAFSGSGTAQGTTHDKRSRPRGDHGARLGDADLGPTPKTPTTTEAFFEKRPGVSSCNVL